MFGIRAYIHPSAMSKLGIRLLLYSAVKHCAALLCFGLKCIMADDIKYETKSLNLMPQNDERGALCRITLQWKVPGCVASVTSKN